MGYGAGAKKLFALVLERRVLEAAASLAFRFFLSALPLLTLLGYALGELVRVRGVDALLDPLAVVLPDVTENLLREELTRLAGSSHPALAPLAVVGFLWLGSGGAHHLLNVLAAVVAAPRRPWLRQRALALALTVATLAAGSLYALARFELRALLRASSPRPPAVFVAPGAAPGEPAFPLAR